MQILDVGSGRLPCRTPDLRPSDCHYVGLDISAAELAAAESGSYDECVVADIAGPRDQELVGRFDLVVSFQVLEHVRPLDRALDNMHAYLRPGGRLVAQMSGTFAPFSLLGKVMPQRPKVWLLSNSARSGARRDLSGALRPLLRERAAPAHTGMERGRDRRVAPGRVRTCISRRCSVRVYLVYERGLTRRGLDDLAAYFIVEATKAPARR